MLEYLKIDPSKTRLALIMNADSHLYGTKDIIKIEDEENVDLDVLGLVARQATVASCAAARSSASSSPRCRNTW